jgi:hypothetical protein
MKKPGMKPVYFENGNACITRCLTKSAKSLISSGLGERNWTLVAVWTDGDNSYQAWKKEGR